MKTFQKRLCKYVDSNHPVDRAVASIVVVVVVAVVTAVEPYYLSQ